MLRPTSEAEPASHTSAARRKHPSALSRRGPTPPVSVIIVKDGATVQRVETQDQGVPGARSLSPKTCCAAYPQSFAHHQHASQFHLGKSEVVGLKGDADQAYGSELAERGYVVIAPDALAYYELATRLVQGRTLLSMPPRRQDSTGGRLAVRRLMNGSRILPPEANDNASGSAPTGKATCRYMPRALSQFCCPWGGWGWLLIPTWRGVAARRSNCRFAGELPGRVTHILCGSMETVSGARFGRRAPMRWRQATSSRPGSFESS